MIRKSDYTRELSLHFKADWWDEKNVASVLIGCDIIRSNHLLAAWKHHPGCNKIVGNDLTYHKLLLQSFDFIDQLLDVFFGLAQLASFAVRILVHELCGPAIQLTFKDLSTGLQPFALVGVDEVIREEITRGKSAVVVGV